MIGTLISLLLSLSPQAQAQNALKKLKCGDNVQQKLVGQKFPSGKVKDLEKTYAGLNLKILGGGPADESYFVNAVKICDVEYLVLFDQKNPKKQDIVKDVLIVPPHSKEFPMFSDGVCKKADKTLTRVYGVFSNPSKTDVSKAWQVDLAKFKFVELSTDKLNCQESDIDTADGGL